MIWINSQCYECGKSEINCDDWFDVLDLPKPDSIKCKECSAIPEIEA